MEEILKTGRIIFITLLVFILILIMFRFASKRNRKEFILFIAVLFVLGIKAYFSHFYLIGIGTSLLLIYVTGNLLFTIAGDRHNFLWNSAIGTVSVILILAILLKLTHNIYFPIFYLAIMGIAFIYPFILMMKLYRMHRSPILLFLLFTSGALIAARGVDIYFGMTGLPELDLTLWSSIALTLGMGYLLYEESRIIEREPSPKSDITDQKEKWLSVFFSRISGTEKTMLLQDRIIASGILAISAIHEFKNILTHIMVIGQYGLVQDSLEKKQKGIEAILENAEHAHIVVKKYLDTAALEIDEKPELIDIKNDLSDMYTIIRSRLHRERIDFDLAIDDGLCVFIGKGELEQVIANIIRNSIEALAESSSGKKTIGISAKKESDRITIDFSDSGRGVPENFEHMLFAPHISGKGSSGIGLSLVKLLLARNGGSIEYHPAARCTSGSEAASSGARFRVILPEAETSGVKGIERPIEK